MKTVASPPEEIRMLFDLELMRPACVILQAISGGDTAAFRRYFGGADNWLTSPTPGMKMVSGTAEEWQYASEWDTRRQRPARPVRRLHRPRKPVRQSVLDRS
jgi:hypothetical protein